MQEVPYAGEVLQVYYIRHGYHTLKENMRRTSCFFVVSLTEHYLQIKQEITNTPGQNLSMISKVRDVEV
jgi:hypothetical protein